ncbi:MAG: HAD-IIIA family hydrolase [Myxococcales bacterium]|nr:HAD-IIIA family hydrolase [Myxococcales bacterium]
MQAIVLAGGRGQRLDPRGEAPPKPLTPLCGLPLLHHLLGWLASEGVREAILCTGYGAEQVERSVGDGRRFGLSIRFSAEPSPLGTAGAVGLALPMLEERFVVVYGDVLASVDLASLLRAHRSSGAWATLAVHPNDHPVDSDRCIVDAQGFVTELVLKEARRGPEAGALCNAGLFACERRLAEEIPADGRPRDFARDVFPSLAGTGRRLFAYRTAEYLRDMGTAERLAKVERDVREGVPASMRRSAHRPALLADRDGVLVEELPHLRDPQKLRLLPGVAPALSRLNRAGLLAACVTNQPVVARGELSEQGLKEVHDVLEGLLGLEGAHLDGIFVCPHHPDRGFEGERAELKIHCACRKPFPGLVDDADRALGVDRRASVVVGDRTADLEAARAAGVLGVGVLTGAGCKDGRHRLPPETPLVPDLASAVALMLDTAPSWDPWLDRILAARIVTLGGPSRAGKTLAAAALRLRLQARGMPVTHLSLDRFIVPAHERRSDSTASERNRLAEASEAASSLARGLPVLTPGYDPRTRDRAASEVVHWPGRGVLVVEGVLAGALELPGALSVSLAAQPEVLRARREAFYRWKGLEGGALFAAVDGRSEEEDAVAELSARAALRLRLDEKLRLEPEP